MTDTSRSRESLSLRVNSTVKQQYEDRILEKFGVLQPYAGTELERELRVLVDQGELARLVDKTHELARSIGETTSENKKFNANRSGDSEVIGYRVHSEVRRALKSEAQRASGVTYASELVESVMLAYASGDQTESKVADRLDRIEEFVESNTSDKGVVTRRTEDIIGELQNQEQFTLDDFDEAVDTAASGINSGEYARKEYLHRVLNKLNYTTQPRNAQLFSPLERVDPSEQDPRNKLPFLRDESDIKEIILFDALSSGLLSAQFHVKYTPSDAKQAVGKGLSQDQIRRLFDRIASTCDKIKLVESDGYLSIDGKSFNSISRMDFRTPPSEWVMKELREL